MIFKPNTNKGFSYLETVIALGILSIITVSIFPLFQDALALNNRLEQREKLVDLAYYVGDYIHNWSEFSPSSKIVPFEFYQDGNELELSNDLRINHLQFVDPLLTSNNYSLIPTNNLNLVPDNYKASIKFYETASVNRAVIQVKVWYDNNLDDVIDVTENVVQYTTILTEKLNE